MKNIIILILITIFWYLVFSYLFMSFNPNDFIATNITKTIGLDCKLFQVMATLTSYVLYFVIIKENK